MFQKHKLLRIENGKFQKVLFLYESEHLFLIENQYKFQLHRKDKT